MNLLNGHKEPDLEGQDFKITIHPRLAKAGPEQPGWVVQGKVLRPFAVDPPVVDFAETLIRGEPFGSRAVTILSGLDVSELRADSSALTVKVTRDTINPRQFRLEIQPRTDMPGGFFNHQVRLTGVTPNRKAVPGTVSVVGRILEDVGLAPEVLAFGAEPVGSKLGETVVLHSRSGQSFVIQEIDTGGVSAISVAVGQKREDGSHLLDVSCVVAGLGHQQHTIHVKVKGRQGLLDLSLPLGYHGIPAQKEVER